MKALIEEAFAHFGKNELYEEQFRNYFKARGMSKEEADRLWIDAHAMDIITIGVRPIFREDDPLTILGHVSIFRLVEKEI